MTVKTVMEEERSVPRSVCGSCCSLEVVVTNTAQLLRLSIREYCRPSHATTSRKTGDIEAMVVSSWCRCAWVRLLMLSGRTRGCSAEQQDFPQRSTWVRSRQQRSDLDLQSASSSHLSLQSVNSQTGVHYQAPTSHLTARLRTLSIRREIGLFILD